MRLGISWHSNVRGVLQHGQGGMIGAFGSYVRRLWFWVLGIEAGVCLVLDVIGVVDLGSVEDEREDEDGDGDEDEDGCGVSAPVLSWCSCAPFSGCVRRCPCADPDVRAFTHSLKRGTSPTRKYTPEYANSSTSGGAASTKFGICDIVQYSSRPEFQYRACTYVYTDGGNAVHHGHTAAGTASNPDADSDVESCAQKTR